MIELICFVRRKPGMASEAFYAHWLSHHAALIRDTPDLARHILRYEQSHRIVDAPRGVDDGGYDGVTVQQFDAMSDFVAFLNEPAYAELIRPDEESFLEQGTYGLIFADAPRIVIPQREATAGAGAKLMCLIRRRADIEAEVFHAHWSSAHAAIFRDTPELARHILGYRQHSRLESDYLRDGDGPPGFDGMTEQWFASPEGFWSFSAEPAIHEKVAADELSFMRRDALVWLISGPPHVIIGD